jgi:hypothetical protein
LAVMVVRLFYLFPALFSLMRWNLWVLFTLPSIAMTFLLARLTASFGAQGRETGTLEILLTTPVSWWEIVRVQKRIYIEAVRIPAGLLIGMDILMHAKNNAFGPSADPLAALLYFASNTVSTVLFFMSIFWVALYFSLRSNSALHAAGKATLLVTLLPMLGSYIAPLLFRSFLFISLAPYALMMIVSSSLHAGIYVAMILWAKKRITPHGYSTSLPRTRPSLSWVRLPWERVRRVGQDVL